MDTPKTKLKTEKLRRSTLSQFFSFQFRFWGVHFLKLFYY